MLLQSVLTKLAAAGLATKAAAGGAAVVVAASAAGAADALPEPAQEAFDRITVEETVEVEDTAEAAGDAGADDADANFGERVSEDAKDGGVDGCEIARAASGRALDECGTDADDVEDAEDDESDAMEGFGEEVAEDARGDAEGDEPGVDGEEISQEARERNPGDAEGDAGADVEAAEDDDDDDDDEGGPEGTPGEAAVNTFRPGDDG